MAITRRGVRIAGRIMRLLLLILILAVSGVLGWRVCYSEKYEITKGLTLNEPLIAAYAEHGEDLILRYQEDRATITKAEKNYGYFSVIEYVFIPQANQLQVVVRYNNSTLKHLAEDYGLSEIPDRELDHYDVSVVLTTDLTPEDPSDNEDESKLSRVRLHPTGDPIRESTALYNYRRYTFDNVTLTEDTLGAFVDIYYNQDVNYEADAYGTLLIYDNESPWVDYKLSKDELKRLNAAVGR